MLPRAVTTKCHSKFTAYCFIFQNEVSYKNLQPYTEYTYTAVVINNTKEEPTQPYHSLKTDMGGKSGFFFAMNYNVRESEKFSLSFKVCEHVPTMCTSPSQCPSKFSIMSVGTASQLDKSVWNPFCLSLIDTMLNFDRHCNTDGPILGTYNGWFTYTDSDSEEFPCGCSYTM